MIRCADCTHIQDSSDDLMKVGLMRCDLEREPGRFHTIHYRRECGKFSPSPAGTGAAIIARVDEFWAKWTERLRERKVA